MKIAHFARIRVLCKPEDEKEIIEKQLRKLLPYNLEDEKLEIKKTNSVGFGEKNIVIMEVELKKDKHTSKFINYLFAQLNKKQKDLIISQLDSRIDNGNNFFLRLNKEKLLKDKYEITDEGNCFHISITIAAFPVNKEKAKELITELLNQNI